MVQTPLPLETWAWAPIYISTKSYIALGGGIGVVQNPTPPPPERVSPFRMPHAMTGGRCGAERGTLSTTLPCPTGRKKLGGIGKGRM